MKAITVTQLNRYAKMLLESDQNLKDVLVKGEITSFHRHFQTGHLFFSIKDNSSSIKVVMFASAANRLAFQPENGMSVLVRGSISLFERDGNYQFYAKDILPEGVGSMQLALEQLKAKLQKEGLFDEKHKKPIPRLPKKIALITSKSGAAVKDVMQVLDRRYNLATVYLIPVQVQGPDAHISIVNALQYVSGAGHFDVCILTRGGGSQEDLWVFNREEIARAIFQCTVPLISAIGHEIDFTVADLVADLRAPTPSAAAEMVAIGTDELRLSVETLQARAENQVVLKLDMLRTALLHSHMRLKASSPTEKLVYMESILKGTSHNFQIAMKMALQQREEKLQNTAKLIESYNPSSVLERGYTIAQKKDKILRSVDKVTVGESISLKFVDGRAECTVNSVEKGSEQGAKNSEL